ncbi:hypothetical protein GCM10025780_05630 [Frondihabitans cladoniiphilus]|uniref:Uncharacterized protein n=1 Tax=Frondihabitans cladoniiphilus TaxID=715785 RepID=A0ABP8VNP6_9MICO
MTIRRHSINVRTRPDTTVVTVTLHDDETTGDTLWLRILDTPTPGRGHVRLRGQPQQKRASRQCPRILRAPRSNPSARSAPVRESQGLARTASGRQKARTGGTESEAEGTE